MESLRAYTWNQNLIWFLQSIKAYPGQVDRWRFWRDGFGSELEVIDRNEFKIKSYVSDKDYHWDLWYFSSLSEIWQQSSILLIDASQSNERFRLFFYGLDGSIRHCSWKSGKISKPSIFSYPIEILLKIFKAIQDGRSDNFIIIFDLENLKEKKEYQKLYEVIRPS